MHCCLVQSRVIGKTKDQERRVEVNEMRTLMWMCGVMKKDKIRN